ncbi:MAG: DAK2 domain-containing protein [Eubacteriaceae bacterium]|nr:DAK2 domain-containing protein [Eubacteriaceae bacterium]
MPSIITAQLFVDAIESAYANLDNNKQAVNDLNVFPVPDGDTGTNMSLTLKYAVKEAKSQSGMSISEAVSAASNGALIGARGNSGVILSQLFRGFSKHCNGIQELDCANLAEAIASASSMAYKAVIKPTEGTILTISREIAEKAQSEEFSSVESMLEALIEHGRIALSKTPEQLAVLKEAGVVDAGGAGLILILEGALAAIAGNPVSLAEAGTASASFATEQIPNIQSAIEYAYCTEFLVTALDGQQHDKFLIEQFVKLGDSLLVIQDGAIIKIHVHTNEPWTVMKTASSCGELTQIKIDNMREQHKDLFTQQHAPSSPNSYQMGVPAMQRYEYYTIAVSSGSGLSNILMDLGVNHVIEGGQSMNPSTEEFLSAINAVDADSYILLPNNKNIIMAASQASAMTEKDASVVESRSIPQAIRALMEFNPDEGKDSNVDRMRGSLKSVATAEITYAVRDTKLNKKSIKKGDIIAMIDGDMKVAEKSIDKAVVEAVSIMASQNPVELITLYYGNGIKESDAMKLQQGLRGMWPDLDIEVFNGGQPVYYYIVSAE